MSEFWRGVVAVGIAVVVTLLILAGIGYVTSGDVEWGNLIHWATGEHL